MNNNSNNVCVHKCSGDVVISDATLGVIALHRTSHTGPHLFVYTAALLTFQLFTVHRRSVRCTEYAANK